MDHTTNNQLHSLTTTLSLVYCHSLTEQFNKTPKWMDKNIHSIHRREMEHGQFLSQHPLLIVQRWTFMLFRYSDVGRDRYILNFIRAWVVAEDEIGPVVGEDSSVIMLHLTTSSTPLSHPVVQWCVHWQATATLLGYWPLWIPASFGLCA